MPGIDATRLTDLMTAKGISTTQLASTVGVAAPTISQLRSGERNAERRPALRKAIADALRVPTARIEIDPTQSEPDAAVTASGSDRTPGGSAMSNVQNTPEVARAAQRRLDASPEIASVLLEVLAELRAMRAAIEGLASAGAR